MKKNANTRFFFVRGSVIGVLVGLGPAAVLWGRPTAAGVLAMANAPAMHPPNGQYAGEGESDGFARIVPEAFNKTQAGLGVGVGEGGG